MTGRARRVESFVLDENLSAIVFYLAGAGAGLSLLVGGHLSHRDLAVIVSLIACLFLGTWIRISFRDRLSPAATQLLFTAAWLLITVAAAIGPSVHVDLALFYIWLSVYAALYFEPVWIVLQISGAAVAYLVVLLASHVGARALVVSWLSIFGTSAVLGGVVFVLVSTLKRNSREDQLTGLSNRRTWDERVDGELQRSRRSGVPVSVVSIDVDNFKFINDSQGHAAGDRLLRDVATAWSAEVRGGSDLIARVGGDEFGMLATGSDHQDIVALVQRLHDALPEGVSCSMGMATWDHSETAADLFRRADEEMYRAKRLKKSS